LRLKEQETHLILHEHDDDDDGIIYCRRRLKKSVVSSHFLLHVAYLAGHSVRVIVLKKE